VGGNCLGSIHAGTNLCGLILNWVGYCKLSKMTNKRKKVFVSLWRFQIGTRHIHGYDLERNFRFIHFTEWCHKFTIFLLSLTWVTAPYIVLMDLRIPGYQNFREIRP
jgi:hypothetical protein